MSDFPFPKYIVNERLTASEFAEEVVLLFDEYSDYFGCCDHCVSDDCFDHGAQDEYTRVLSRLVCLYRGHEFTPDHCGKPEHYFCRRCRKLRSDIETQEDRHE